VDHRHDHRRLVVEATPRPGRRIMTTLLLHDDVMLGHDAGRGHPERPERLRAIVRALESADFGHVRWAPPAPASRDHLRGVHTAAHVDALLARRGATFAFDGETVLGPGSIDAALAAAGAVVDAVDAVIAGAARNAFALVRPPGHHAEPDRAMGFCLLNNIAIGAAHAVARHGLQRVLVVDFDVHHGNGTQAAFFGRADVLYFSIHQWPLFPGTGRPDERGTGAGAGATVNVPVPAGLGDADYLALLDAHLAPVAAAYRPELVLVSAGFDAHVDDPLGGMRLTADGFASIVRRLDVIAEAHARGRMVLVLEGGYDVDALADSAVACVEALGDDR
jgi:acetoin utilization deacetylase AcuC-like enzyme